VKTGNAGPKVSGIVSGMVRPFQMLREMQKMTAFGNGLPATMGLIPMKSQAVTIVTLLLHVMESIER
jgi:hypothetical protein